MNTSDIILCAVLIIVGAALVWFIVELILTIRSTRATVTELNESIKPSIENIEKITDDVQVVMKKVDPLVERVSLTVDAANLEIMRVDEILGDVSKITGSVSKTVGAVDSVTSAPIDFVTTATKKFRQKFSPKYASDESMELGKSESDTENAAENNPIVQFAEAVGSAAVETIDERREQKERDQQAAELDELKDEAKKEKMDASAERVLDETSYQITIDTDNLLSQDKQ